MKLRKWQENDYALLAELFFNTVHAVNAKDYSKDQLDVWATGSLDIPAWNDSFLKHTTLVAEIDGIIVGFGDMDTTGCLDKLYVHKDYQGKGIATAIVNELEEQSLAQGISSFFTYASITAKPFFEKCGYTVLRENTIVRSNVTLTNYVMKKVHNCQA